MSKILVPLPDLQLDPRNTQALLSSIQTKIFLESGGALNDFSSASPLAALTEGQAYAQSELLYYLNALPEAFVIQWLKLMGIQRIIGSHSYADLVFFRQQGYQRTVMIPAGTDFFSGSGLKFTLVDAVELTSDEPVTGLVRSDKWGTVYNVPANSITRVSTPVPGLGSFYNPADATGGEAQESVGEMKSRALTTLSRRVLSTKLDYQQEIQTLFPELTDVSVFTYDDLSPFFDGLSRNILYISTTGGSEFVRSQMLQALALKSPLGTEISTLDPIYNYLKVDATFEYSTATVGNIDSVTNQIYQSLVSVFREKAMGETLTYLEVFNAANVFQDSLALDIISVGALKLFADEFEPVFGQGCSDEYATVIDSDGICTPDYLWGLDDESLRAYVPTPLDVYEVYEVNILMINSETANTTTFTFKNV